MDILDVTDVKIYLDNKVASQVTGLVLTINETTVPNAKGVLTRVVSNVGSFTAGIKEIQTDVLLENWRDKVIRLKSLTVDTSDQCEGSVDEEESMSEEEATLEEEAMLEEDSEL